jgi:hypothetical protein
MPALLYLQSSRVLGKTILITGEKTVTTLRQLCAATALTIMLSVSAFSGEMTTVGKDPIIPPPPPPPEDESRNAGGTSSETPCPYDALTEAALLYCHNILAVL